MWNFLGRKSDPKPTGYWRQEKDSEGRVTGIFELMSDGTEVETGYKHAYDDSGIDLPWWKTLLAFVIFTPICIIGIIRDIWRSRK